MSEDFVLNLAREALSLVLLLSAPALIISLVVGLLISIFQATTQIQDQTLSFVPKLVVVFIALVVFGSWMINTATAFTANLLGSLAVWGR